MSNLPPSGEIPRGAIRFNTDSNKPELWDGSQWAEFQLSTPNLGRSVDTEPGARAVIGGGNDINNIDYINISSTGNAENFGDLFEKTYQMATFGSNTRSVWAGGSAPTTNPDDRIQFVTISSTGNTTDFGNLSQARRNPGGTGNATRGITAGGASAGETTVYDTIDYVTISATGNAVDFGNLTRSNMVISGGIQSPIRGVFGGGTGVAPGYAETNVIDFITIATLGNAQDFGDLSAATAAPAGTSNSVRGIFAGGATDLVPSHVLTDDISYITISSGGNATSFGNLVAAYNVGQEGGTSNKIRGLFCTGYVAPGPSAVSNVIQYINIATQGDAVDFGDAAVASRYRGAVSNAHGGL